MLQGVPRAVVRSVDIKYTKHFFRDGAAATAAGETMSASVSMEENLMAIPTVSTMNFELPPENEVRLEMRVNKKFKLALEHKGSMALQVGIYMHKNMNAQTWTRYTIS